MLPRKYKNKQSQENDNGIVYPPRKLRAKGPNQILIKIKWKVGDHRIKKGKVKCPAVLNEN